MNELLAPDTSRRKIDVAGCCEGDAALHLGGGCHALRMASMRRMNSPMMAS